MPDPPILNVINTVLISVTMTLAAVIYRDMMRRIERMDKQVIACLCALIAIVNHVEHLPDHILADLQRALQGASTK